MNSRILRLAVAVAVLLPAKAFSVEHLILEFDELLGVDKAVTQGAHADVIETGPSNIPAVAVTLDDGPSQFTGPALDKLAAHGAKSTFFMIGQNVGPHAGDARRVVAAGHEVANHTNTHQNFCGGENPARRRQLEDEVRKAASAIEQATGVSPKLMRFPYGCSQKWATSAVERMGYGVVLWSVDCQDWKRPGSDRITRVVLSQVKAGSIILLHDGGGDRSQTVQALGAILSGLSAKGLKAVTVSDLIKANPHLQLLHKADLLD
ncbi:MAG: polysaccharide deacetylase family protein [Elusimicrobia bacterium]|nr:polysaccharide deacetylase family protein [Elusimicrobiota bacterium]